ncbi:MAG: ABC transporter ATP-binding protein [Gammaproteobacteria bacterium]|jgi:branched-chain amino acid transport system ATP-binding protein
MLEIDHIDVAYGSIQVLFDVSMTVAEGEIVSVIGPNGAGKTTLFNTISGIVDPLRGSVRWDGRNLNAMPAASRAHLGIAHVPEGRQVFPSLSVVENLEMGAFARRSRSGRAATLEKLYAWFPRLAQRGQQAAGTLSGGEQQMLAIARGLASSPRLLMLDEPSMGLAPAIADDIFEKIVAIQQSENIGVLLVEQRVAEALDFAQRAYVLESGRIILEGDHDELRSDERIKAAYLGM